MRDGFLSVVLRCASGTLLLRDRVSGRLGRARRSFGFEKERLTLQVGERRLAAVYVWAGEDAPVVLICHGIGERVEYWAEVQRMLRELGVSSMVFNYAGYGESEGSVSAKHCEEDARGAHAELVRRGHGKIVLLGYSMGTGVAAAVAGELDVCGVVLCAGFTNFREAAVAAGMPGWMAGVFGGVWPTVETVCSLRMPVLVMHSGGDKLFPVGMAERVAGACGGELRVVEGLGHNTPIFAPTREYWGLVAEWVRVLCSNQG